MDTKHHDLLDRHWAAGLLDANSTKVYTHQQKYPIIQLSHNSLEVLRRFHEITHPNDPSDQELQALLAINPDYLDPPIRRAQGSKVQYKLVYQGKHAASILILLAPYSLRIVQKEFITLSRELQRLKSDSKRSLSDPDETNEDEVDLTLLPTTTDLLTTQQAIQYSDDPDLLDSIVVKRLGPPS